MDRTNCDTIYELMQCNEEALVKSRDWYAALEAAVNHLINNDFSGLVQLLYRVDVDEEKLANRLKANPMQDAATIISNLLLERQLQKMAQLQKFRTQQKSA